MLLHLLGKKLQDEDAFDEPFRRLRDFSHGRPDNNIICTILSYVDPKRFIILQHLNREIYYKLAPRIHITHGGAA